MIIVLRFFCVVFGLCVACAWADGLFEPPPSKPLSPRDEQTTFRLPKGFIIELVAAEPDVVDPVAMAFDEKGRLFVAEMRGYPNGGVGKGMISSGRIRLLEDKNGDGYFETSKIFADNLRFPTSVMPYKGGLLVANAPDLIYLEDSKGEGKADKVRVLYTGFDVDNIQQLLSGLQWGIDNWVHACAGGKGGTIMCPENPKMKPVELRDRGIRFKPDLPGKLEPTSGGGQFGLTQDEWGHWFTATNSQHLRHIVLPDHYLARNPNLAVAAVTLDIPDHGAACKVHRISPFESWRIERTKRRKGSPDSTRFPSTELIPGGFITSACSPLVYLADLFPREFRGNVLVCDPANNLIHRDILEPNGGATFVARRADKDCEFLASTDNWFRPVWLTLGPDGAIYIADFYREVIETPLSLPEDMKKVLPLKSQGRGRIWRVRPDGQYRGPSYDLTKSTAKELVEQLESPNAWWRMTAQRLLVERKADVQDSLATMVTDGKTPQSRAHALWTLDGLGIFRQQKVLRALADPEPLVRVHALRAAEPQLASRPGLAGAAEKLADDPSPAVRFQLALTASALPRQQVAPTLARLAGRDGADSWVQTAILNSGRGREAELMRIFLETTTTLPTDFLGQLAKQMGFSANEGELAESLRGLERLGLASQLAVLEGIGRGLQSRGRSLADVFGKPGVLEKSAPRIREMFHDAKSTCLDGAKPVEDRVRAARLLSLAQLDVAADALSELLHPRQPHELQLAAIRSVADQADPKAARLLLSAWAGLSPTLRREATVALLARPERSELLLAAIAAKTVLPVHLEPARLEQLRNHPNEKLRSQARKLLEAFAGSDRDKVVDRYRLALDAKSDPANGKAVFKRICAACHRLDNQGTEVGPDLLSALASKTPEKLLVDIFDPSRDVDPRYIEYTVATDDGRFYTGMIAAETSAGVTLRRAEKVEETILRSRIDRIASTAKSLMPEGLESQLSRQDVADVIAYLLGARMK